MRKSISMLVGILVIILVLGLPSVSAQPKSTRVSILSIEDPTYRDFTNRVNFDWVGGYDGVFRMSWSGGYVDLKPKFKYSNSNEYTVDTIKSMFPQVGFTSQIIKGSRWKWGINVSGIPAEIVNNVESMVFEVVDYSGIDTFQIRVEGNIVVYKDMYALDWRDVLGDGFTIESITKTRVEIGNIQANIVGGVLFIDPMIQPYPYEDGYLERDEFGVFDVYLTTNPMKVGNDAGVTDRIYRIYMKFNTSEVDPWDTLLNATFHGRVALESCAGESCFWIQKINNYGDLGASDWDIFHINITIWYNTTTNSSGWHEARIDDAIVKGGVTYLRMQGTYELYGGVNCFLNVNTNESLYEPYVEIWYEDGVAVTPPAVEIIYPLNHTIASGDAVSITVNVTDPNLDTILANVTFPNSTSVILSGFGKSLPSDDFSTDTEGINWVKNNITSGSQVCNVDIDGTVADKLFIELNGSDDSETMHCGYNSLKRVDGDFDLNVSFDIDLMENDSFFSLRSNSIDSFFGCGIRVYTAIFQHPIHGLEYRFGYFNGTATTFQHIHGVNDTSGVFRIKRNNTATSPTFYLYYWNNSMWNNVHGEISLPTSSRAQIVQFKAGSEPTNFGALNMTIDDFEITSDPYDFVVFSETSTEGEYNVTIIANDTYGAVNNTESTIFQSVVVNHLPSRPFFVEPDNGDTIFGLYEIMWGLVIDEDGDSLKYNISLLDANGTFITDIVTDYGCCITTSYIWNTTQHMDGYYKLKITVYENETAEGLSTSETSVGSFRIRNIDYGNETLSSLTPYYSPYVTPDVQQTIYAVVKIDGVNYDDAFVVINLDNITELMTWDNLTESYIIYWIPTEEGTYNFTISATANNTLEVTGSILVADPFCIEVHLWNNETMVSGTEYKNEWAWVYATKVYDPSLRRLFGRDRITCPPQGDPECHWYGKYVNGSADVCLYDEGNYSFYIIGNNIRWEQNIGSGVVVENCSHCPPNVISKKFFYPLGNYYFDEAEILHLYISPMDRYVFGAFFGIGLSWVGVLVSAIIGFIFFMFALKWSGSIKTALAVLILLPTIIYIVLHLALFAG